MENQKNINLLDNATNQPSEFRTEFGLKSTVNHEEGMITVAFYL